MTTNKPTDRQSLIFTRAALPLPSCTSACWQFSLNTVAFPTLEHFVSTLTGSEMLLCLQPFASPVVSDSLSPPCRPAGGVLYAATVKNYLGTEPIISRAVGRTEDWIRTETLPSWLNGGERGRGARWGTELAEAEWSQAVSVVTESTGLPSPSLCCSRGLEPSRLGG